jgi:hypothetical protein
MSHQKEGTVVGMMWMSSDESVFLKPSSNVELFAGDSRRGTHALTSTTGSSAEHHRPGEKQDPCDGHCHDRFVPLI